MSPSPAFIDSAEVFVKAGRGGKGCCSFHKDKLARYPRPDGGSGGRGGDVKIRAERNIHTLLDFQYKRHFKARPGEGGGPNNRQGKRGVDFIISVPVGSEVRDRANKLIADLTKDGEEVIVARGGAGGRGNYGLQHDFKHIQHPGEDGEEREINFELKLLADVGVIGEPNAGKSSFVCRVSGAKIKIADYPFTTKSPHLGIVRAEDGTEFVIADIPGLIEGAHTGKGLGDKFLRHIERTRLLLHIVDMSGIDGRDPVSKYRSLNEELRRYGSGVDEKPQILACNKMDLPSSSVNFSKFKKEITEKAYPISCLTGEGIDELLKALRTALLSIIITK